MLKQPREPELWTTSVVVVDAPSHSEKPAHILAYREVFRSTAEPRHVGLVAFQIRLVSGRMNHCGEFTVFVFPPFLVPSSLPVRRQRPSLMQMKLSQLTAHFPADSQSTLQSREGLSGADSISTQRCARTVIYGFQLMTSDTEREVQGDFPWAVLIRSVTRAEFLASFFPFFCKGGRNLLINLRKWRTPPLSV